MDKIRLLIVDDHPVVRAGLRTLLGAQPDMQIVGEANDGETAVEHALEIKPDVVVMDIRLLGGSGIDACRKIVEQAPEVKVIMLTSYAEDEKLFDASAADGAVGVTALLVKGRIVLIAATAGLVREIRDVDYLEAESEVDALLVEARLVKDIQPGPQGAAPADLIARGGFRFSAVGASQAGPFGNPWRLLETPLADGAIPAFADAATAR